ncbi:MAG: hypothetical protein WCN95_00765 [bacterium]
MIIRRLIVVSMLAVFPFVAQAAEKETGTASTTNKSVASTELPRQIPPAKIGSKSTNSPVAGVELQSKMKAEREDARERQAEKQVEQTKVLNETWPKDEPRVFEWNADQCRAELAKVMDRERKLQDVLMPLRADPEVKALQEEIAKLSTELAKKRQEYSRKIRQKSVTADVTPDVDGKKAETVKELQKLGSLRIRIQMRLTKVTSDAAKKAATNAFPVVQQPVTPAPVLVPAPTPAR